MRTINFWTIAMLALSVSSSHAFADSVSTRMPDWPSSPTTVDRAQVDALIDQLTSISAEGVGFSTMAEASSFPPVDTIPKFEGGILGTRPPSSPTTIKELVSLGVRAVPELIDHLSDKRSTKFVAKLPFGGGFGAMWYSNEFDVGPNDHVQHPVGTRQAGTRQGHHVDFNIKDNLSSWPLSVGDVCFVVIGQIVNRPYNAVRPQPSACLVINSPTHTPALADAVKVEWSDLTDDQLRDSLIHDTEDAGSNSSGALERLCYYYPDEGKRLAPKILARPIYPRDVVNLPGFKDVIDAYTLGETIAAIMAFHDDDIDRAVLSILSRLTKSTETRLNSNEVDWDPPYDAWYLGGECVHYLDGHGYKEQCTRFVSDNVALVHRVIDSQATTDKDRKTWQPYLSRLTSMTSGPK